MFPTMRKSPNASYREWHERLGHFHVGRIRELQNQGKLTAFGPSVFHCGPCRLAKSHRLASKCLPLSPEPPLMVPTAATPDGEQRPTLRERTPSLASSRTTTNDQPTLPL
ncbi:hypothetical protein BKA80DRAFT_263867, partial [Phyllosticta citrichinensis]